ncbi:MAG: hypothetical protein ACRDTF_06985 [Pseudonocardiaceae bacterium]
MIRVFPFVLSCSSTVARRFVAGAEGLPSWPGRCRVLGPPRSESRVFAAFAQAGYGDVTPAQARIFQRIGRHGTRLTELAEAAPVTKQSNRSICSTKLCIPMVSW